MKREYKLLGISFLVLILLGMGMSKTIEAQVKIGVFADCQYCDCETVGNRFYRNSLTKLNDCITSFNAANDLDFVVGLGDLIDRDFKSFKEVNRILSGSKHKVYQVTGNHDYSVDSIYMDKVPGQLNLSNTYYSIQQKNWLFIFLDGNDVTFNSNNKEIVKQAEELIEELTRSNQPNNKEWNGGIGDTQLQWFKKELQHAEKEKLNVSVFCHYPLLPLETHTLWNSKEILSVLNEYNCVKVWINGHNHAGNYAEQNGIHFITLKGMVDTETENAYSLISFLEKEIEIIGFGREESCKIQIK